MTVHTNHEGKNYLTYNRPSARHNWQLGLIADSESGLERNLKLDSEFFAGWQHAYMITESQSFDDVRMTTAGIMTERGLMLLPERSQ